MYKLKNNKATTKRFIKRKSGKIQKKKQGQGHYNANDSAPQKGRKKGLATLPKGVAKQIAGQLLAQ